LLVIESTFWDLERITHILSMLPHRDLKPVSLVIDSWGLGAGIT
jgi:hypothetical protein